MTINVSIESNSLSQAGILTASLDALKADVEEKIERRDSCARALAIAASRLKDAESALDDFKEFTRTCVFK